MQECLIIENLKVMACHGVNPEEKVNPQPFLFTAKLYFDLSKAEKSDNLYDTINYSKASKAIINLAIHNSFDLIEKLASETALMLLREFPKIDAVELTVRKPEAPMRLDFESVGVKVFKKRSRAYISLGSSMGDREKILDEAFCELEKEVKVLNRSSYHETEPFGGVAKNKFLNAAALIETYMSPLELLDFIHDIEKKLGRVRKQRWEDRLIDIDILTFNFDLICDEKLIVPHPGLEEREFVLLPLSEIAPDFINPATKRRISDILKKSNQ